MADEFDKQTSEAISAAQGAFDVKAGRKNEGFARESDKLKLDMARNREDYLKYTSREQIDFNRNIAAQDKGFARKLSNAANAYGQRGLLRSGFARGEMAEAMGDFQEEQGVYHLNFNRKKEDMATKMSRGEQDFTTDMADVDRRKSEFGYDAGNERRAIEREGQAAADKIWNEGIDAGYRTAEGIQRAKSADKAYGRTPAPTAPAYRRGGKYVTTGF